MLDMSLGAADTEDEKWEMRWGESGWPVRDCYSSCYTLAGAERED